MKLIVLCFMKCLTGIKYSFNLSFGLHRNDLRGAVDVRQYINTKN